WLAANNIRSINNVVDIANLVMLESGQPLHIFDYDTLPEKKIAVRQAHQGEKITALNGQELVLNPEDTIISSGGKVISLAGIIGGQATALTLNTKNILIECASFNPTIIKKTAKRLNISTAASIFFSRRANLFLSPQQVLSQTISLIADTCQDDLDSKTIFYYQKKRKIPLVVNISHEFIIKKVGQSLTQQTIENIWQQLKFPYQKEENNYHITIPLSRPDITIPEDLLEELLRIYDYNKVIGSLSTI
ncbi:13395_t:CDS:1, partial [Ambispora leptoticha]